ncbi:hypothetical protein DFH27DRAFT_618065 [Peziza echinospora]|nr:hypothetical protein DFH27DRAFT_618065 [Peziza echinospora]
MRVWAWPEATTSTQQTHPEASGPSLNHTLPADNTPATTNKTSIATSIRPIHTYTRPLTPQPMTTKSVTVVLDWPSETYVPATHNYWRFCSIKTFNRTMHPALAKPTRASKDFFIKCLGLFTYDAAGEAQWQLLIEVIIHSPGGIQSEPSVVLKTFFSLLQANPAIPLQQLGLTERDSADVLSPLVRQVAEAHGLRRLKPTANDPPLLPPPTAANREIAWRIIAPLLYHHDWIPGSGQASSPAHSADSPDNDDDDEDDEEYEDDEDDDEDGGEGEGAPGAAPPPSPHRPIKGHSVALFNLLWRALIRLAKDNLTRRHKQGSGPAPDAPRKALGDITNSLSTLGIHQQHPPAATTAPSNVKVTAYITTTSAAPPSPHVPISFQTRLELGTSKRTIILTSDATWKLFRQTLQDKWPQLRKLKKSLQVAVLEADTESGLVKQEAWICFAQGMMACGSVCDISDEESWGVDVILPAIAYFRRLGHAINVGVVVR